MIVKVGLSAGELGASWTLPRLVGTGRAAEIAFTGRVVGAAEADRIGLVNGVRPGRRADPRIEFHRRMGHRDHSGGTRDWALPHHWQGSPSPAPAGRSTPEMHTSGLRS